MQNPDKNNETILKKWFYKWTGRQADLTFIGLLAELGVQKVESILCASSYFIYHTKISLVLLIQNTWQQCSWWWVLFLAFKLNLSWGWSCGLEVALWAFINSTWTNEQWYEFYSSFSFKYNWCNWKQSTNPRLRGLMITFHNHFFQWNWFYN